MTSFKDALLQGIPERLPENRPLDPSLSHAPRRKKILTAKEEALALKNALRYFKKTDHAVLAPEFLRELRTYGRIYMYRLRPEYPIAARPLKEFPHQSKQAAAIMLMISNNLDPKIAQHPEELITYGGNGAVFQNWAQYLLTMKYLATMNDEQTLVMYSGHPMGLFPSHQEAPRVVVTNGLMIPNYSKPDDLEKYNALGVTQYGQMTAGSYMYIGPQGIVHGTTITVLNAGRRKDPKTNKLSGKLFVTSGLGGMSGAQGKAAVIAGAVGIIAEINPKAAEKRHQQGWVDDIFDDLEKLIKRAEECRSSGKATALAYQGNIVDLWEHLEKKKINVDLGSDQTSLHNPWAGGYYPVGLSLDESNDLMAKDPVTFKSKVEMSLKRQVNAINKLSKKGMYFFDYGNAFLLEASRAKADILKADGSFIYPSYVEDIMGPLCFDYGFGPFRWVCASCDEKDLALTDQIAAETLEDLLRDAPNEISQQLNDNLTWIKSAQENNLVVGSQARILYADSDGRIEIALRFNRAIRDGKILGPIILGRDHHDVSGTDSPYRETANIRDGSQFTADMAVQNFVGDAFRGATWISLHNGGGVGWGEVINGGFGMLLDGSEKCDERIRSMLFWDVNNGISRRSWAQNPGAIFAAKKAMQKQPQLRVTLPEESDEDFVQELVKKETF